MSSNVRSSNPKHATLTGTKMADLWMEIRLGAGVIFRVMRDLSQHRSKYKQFRDRWGSRTPRTDAEWLTFWQEFVLLEDDLSSVQDHLLQAHNSLYQAAEEGMEVVRLNGIEDAVEDPLSYIKRSIDRAVELVERTAEK